MKRPLREYKGQQLKIHETRRENCWQAFGWLVPDWFHRSPISAIEISLLIFRRCAEGERTFSDILHADDPIDGHTEPFSSRRTRQKRHSDTLRFE